MTDEARVKVAAAQLAEAQARIGKTEIRAPDDGIVLTRNAEIGQTANPGGEPLFRLARDGEIEMRGQVAERDMATLSVGQSAAIRLTGLAEPFEGKVRLLGAIIDPTSRLGEIRVSLKPHPALRPGAFARGEVIVGAAQRPVLPQTAVLSDAQGTFVLIVNNERQDRASLGARLRHGARGPRDRRWAEAVTSESSRPPARSCAWARKSGSRNPRTPRADGDCNEKHVCMGDPSPGDARGVVRRAVLPGCGGVHPPAHQPEPGHLLPLRHRRASRSRAQRRRRSRRRSSPKIEGAVASIGGVKNIQSTAMEGSAQIGIEFQIGTPVDRAVTDVRDAVSKVRADLPDGIMEPTVTRLDIDGGAMVLLRRQHDFDDGRRALLVRRQHRHQAAARSPASRRSRAAAA